MSNMFAQEPQEIAKQKYELKRNRVVALSGVFSKALSVLTRHKISVHVVDRPEIQAPAYSSTKDVWLNLDSIVDDFTPRSITSLNGLSFHELGHLRYTPRNGSRLVQLIKDNQKQNELWEAFNCLEDNRIELLLTGWLPSIKNWLTATMLDYLLSSDEAITRAFPLVYGRKYLPANLRQLASDKFIKPEIATDLAKIIDEYISLIFTGNDELTDHVFTLIQAFADLLKELPPMTQPNEEGDCVIVRIKNPNGHGSRPTEGYESSSNRPATKSEQERNKNKAKSNAVEVTIKTTKDKEDSTSNSDTEGKTPSTPNNNPATNTGGNYVASDEEGFGDELDIDIDIDLPSSNNDNQSKNAGTKEGTTGSNQQVTDVLQDIFSDVVESLSKEINEIANQIGVQADLDGGNAKTPDKANYNEVRVPDELFTTAKGFGVELERLRADYDPAWLNGERSGKLNANRYLRGDDLDTVFDEWSEGRDDVTEIEAVIALDRSGSMKGTNADNAYKSMWAIKKALERVQARTTVVTFDYKTNLLYGADEKAGSTIRDAGADGGTNPENSILFAKKVFADSEKPIKIFFMITDGQWESKDGEKTITELRNANVLTCQALISDYELNADYLNSMRHNFELMTSIKNAKDILVLGKELVKIAITRNLVNA